MKKVIFLAAVLFLFHINADEDVAKMTMIVTADREPVYLKNSPEIVTVVTAEEIKRLHANSTTEVLEKVAGVFMETGTG
ncbi:MAG TPA: TonB-dependent receptor plug domain-containing protein, partial [bacterium]|nr:TonB-dependent receptor plug domain-containing protein [bacterium]